MTPFRTLIRVAGFNEFFVYVFIPAWSVDEVVDIPFDRISKSAADFIRQGNEHLYVKLNLESENKQMIIDSLEEWEVPNDN